MIINVLAGVASVPRQRQRKIYLRIVELHCTQRIQIWLKIRGPLGMRHAGRRKMKIHTLHNSSTNSRSNWTLWHRIALLYVNGIPHYCYPGIGSGCGLVGSANGGNHGYIPYQWSTASSSICPTIMRNPFTYNCPTLWTGLWIWRRISRDTGWVFKGNRRSDTYTTRFLHQFCLESNALAVRVSITYQETIRGQLGSFSRVFNVIGANIACMMYLKRVSYSGNLEIVPILTPTSPNIPRLARTHSLHTLHTFILYPANSVPIWWRNRGGM